MTDDFHFIPGEELVDVADDLTCGQTENMKSLSLWDVKLLLTVAQYIRDLCILEMQKRGKLSFDPHTGDLLIPYSSDLQVNRVYTRNEWRLAPTKNDDCDDI